MSSVSQPNEQDDGLDAAVDQAIAVCGGEPRATVRALIVANNLLESEIAERAFEIVRQDPPDELSKAVALAEIEELLASIGDTCPECPPDC